MKNEKLAIRISIINLYFLCHLLEILKWPLLKDIKIWVLSYYPDRQERERGGAPTVPASVLSGLPIPEIKIIVRQF